MIRFVLFDAGGTLITPHPSVGEVYRTIALPFGLDASAAAIEGAFRARWVAHVGQRGFGPLTMGQDDEEARAWWKGIVFPTFADVGFGGDFEACFEAIFLAFASPAAWRIYEDVAPALDGLEARGIGKGVLSNWDFRLPPLLEALRLAPRFDPIVVSAHERIEKPDPEIFSRAARRSGYEPSEILYVGDQERLDVEPALAVGMHARLIDRAGRSASTLAVRRLDSILALFDSEYRGRG